MSSLSTPAQAERSLQAAATEHRELIASVHTLDATHWVVAFAHGGSQALEWIDRPARLVCSAGLGAPHPNDEARLLNAALNYNASGQCERYLRIAREHRDGELRLIAQLQAVDLDKEDGLAGALLSFEAARTVWSHTLQAARSGPSAPPPFAPPFHLRA